MGIKQAVTGRQGDRETDQGDNLDRDIRYKGWMRCGWMGESRAERHRAGGLRDRARIISKLLRVYYREKAEEEELKFNIIGIVVYYKGIN